MPYATLSILHVVSLPCWPAELLSQTHTQRWRDAIITMVPIAAWIVGACSPTAAWLVVACLAATMTTGVFASCPHAIQHEGTCNVHMPFGGKLHCYA